MLETQILCHSSSKHQLLVIMARLFPIFVCACVFWIFFIDFTRAIQVTGATGGVNLKTGERPFRFEITKFADSGAAYDLFILALLQLQHTNQSEPLSYFQIAGIHGYPKRPWDGVVGHGPHAGYCTHQAVPFAIWHRPYLALFEASSCLRNSSVIMLIICSSASCVDQRPSYCAHLPTERPRSIHVCRFHLAHTVLGLGGTPVPPGCRESTDGQDQYSKWQRNCHEPIVYIYLSSHTSG